MGAPQTSGLKKTGLSFRPDPQRKVARTTPSSTRARTVASGLRVRRLTPTPLLPANYLAPNGSGYLGPGRGTDGSRGSGCHPGARLAAPLYHTDSHHQAAGGRDKNKADHTPRLPRGVWEVREQQHYEKTVTDKGPNPPTKGPAPNPRKTWQPRLLGPTQLPKGWPMCPLPSP